MIQKSISRAKAHRNEQISKSQFVAYLERRLDRTGSALEQAQDAIHEAKRHLMSGDSEAAFGCLADYTNQTVE